LREEKLITGGQTFTLNYGFDTVDRLISVTYPSSQVVSITPNAYGEPEVVGGYASGFSYHPNGSIASLTYGNGRAYSVTQNDRQLPWELKVMNGGSTVAKYTHTYDANANIEAIDDGVNAASYDRVMTYDDLDRLKTASGFWGSGSYSYDALGNILSKTEGGQAMTYGYQASTNRLTAITGANARSFSYDAYGNVLSNGVHSFQYNLAGNLTRTSDLNIDYRYDGHKRRVQEIDNNTLQTTYSMYSQSGQLMHKLKGGVATDYVYAGSLLVAEKSGSTVDYMYTDLLGSPIAGNNGSAYKEHYRPWGEKKDHPLQLADDVGYTGHQSDIETGLTYMQARYYDPVVGRFYAVDPVGFMTSNPMTFNRYSYVNNNPFRFTDPTGMSAHEENLRVQAISCDADPTCQNVGNRVGATSDSTSEGDQSTGQDTGNDQILGTLGTEVESNAVGNADGKDANLQRNIRNGAIVGGTAGFVVGTRLVARAIGWVPHPASKSASIFLTVVIPSEHATAIFFAGGLVGAMYVGTIGGFSGAIYSKSVADKQPSLENGSGGW
jgi:RHS repeat-associated protein